MSCEGDVFCREDAILTRDAEAIEEVKDDCRRRGGKTNARACSREHIVASCAVTSGELGPITVFAYRQTDEERQRETIATMSDLCEQFEGTLDLARD